MRDRIWTASNLLSLSRIAIVVPVAYLITHESAQNDFYALILVLIAGLTDLFDGFLARTLHQETELGRIIDPLADKICVAVVIGIFAYQGRIPIWFLALALSRDAIIFFGGLYLRKRKGIVPVSNQAGKWAVAFISFLVIVVILNAGRFNTIEDILLGISTVLLILSSILYAMRFWDFIRTTER